VLQATISQRELGSELVVHTEERILRLAPRDGAELAVITPGNAPRQRLLRAPGVDSIQAELQCFLAAVRAKDTASSNLDRWLQVSAVIGAARASLLRGESVPVSRDNAMASSRPIESCGWGSRIGASRGLSLVAV
jgi:hypothetical protein